MKPLTFGSLFAGIGGIDLGLERAGLQCRWQVEIDRFCRRVLDKHWPDVPKHQDVRTFPPAQGNWSVDLIAGGFPCQDISDAGQRAGIDGDRSGLWEEFARIVRVLRPRYVLVENVAAMLYRGMGRVLRDMAECGYDAEWQVLSASNFGAPHLRRRVFVLAYASSERRPANGWFTPRFVNEELSSSDWTDGPWSDVCEYRRSPGGRLRPLPSWYDGRMADGSADRVDRLRGIGNCVLPAIAEMYGRGLIYAQQVPTDDRP